MEQWIELLLFLTFIPVFLIMIFMPYLTRRTESFGVTIPEEMYNHELLKAIRKSYVKQTSAI
jgi:hypothetical protein